MTKIGLLSDTHGWLDDAIFEHFEDCDEIWHAGDFGSRELITQLSDFKPLRGVFGNIDDGFIRREMPEQLAFHCEEVGVCMQHIGGYPARYAPGVRQWLQLQQPQIFISGHSHILKIQFDQSLQCLHLNPGAAGRHGWHQVRTILRFQIHEKTIEKMEIIELGQRGR